MLKTGDKAPLDIKIKNEKDQDVCLRDKLGNFVVLYFYPKDDTPGCTTEACNFRDANQEMIEHGVKIIGVSQDSVQSHQKFKEKYKLNFELWSDPDKKIVDAFGAWGEKKFFGKTFTGLNRYTFIIDQKGTIIKVYKTVKPAEHAAQVQKFIEKFKNS